MKKLSFSLLVMLGFFATLFIACDDEDDTPPAPSAPTISSLSPTSGPVGTSVTIAGSNFGDSPSVSFGGTSATVGSSTATSITTTVPSGLSAGTVSVTVSANNLTSSGVDFEVTEDTSTPDGPAFVGDTIASIESLSTLAAALEATALDDVLNGDGGPYTVFAPNNDAFTALLTALELADLDAVVGALGAEGVTNLLLAHVVADSLGAAEVTGVTDSLETASPNGEKLGILVDGENVFVNGAQILEVDIVAGNGVIHVIDSVINLPELETPKTRVDITDADLAAGETYDWTADNEYFLTGLVFVEGGATLNIEAGTTVRFTEETGDDNTSALVVTQGSQINAIGTADAPIIFTAEADTVGGNLLPSDWGAWGGIIILGNAPTEKNGNTSGIAIEGVDSDETRAVYGGTDPMDNSGTLQYVSIRYTGVGIAPNSEIQGLTLGGVGSGTTIDHIDVYSSNDDGIEIFGGTVDINYASVAFATDDAFDFDEGYRGNIQFAFVLQLDGDETVYDQAGEWDGSVPDDGTSLTAAPNIFNATFIGPGQTSTGAQRALILRDAFAGKLGNSIIEDFPGIGIQVEDVPGDIDSYNYITNPIDGGFQVELLNNSWAQFGGWVEADGVSSLVQATEIDDDPDTAEDETFTGETADVVAELTDNDNDYLTSVVTSISRMEDGGLDPRPAAATSTTTTVPAGMMQVDYRGAFAPGEATWLAGWSTLSKVGILFE
ncbi:MAG: fasciclin domain-containing protein [Cyclobacteriaceae bacterium]